MGRNWNEAVTSGAANGICLPAVAAGISSTVAKYAKDPPKDNQHRTQPDARVIAPVVFNPSTSATRFSVHFFTFSFRSRSAVAFILMRVSVQTYAPFRQFKTLSAFAQV